MSHNIDVMGTMSGGLLAGLARSLLTQESFFTTKVQNNSMYQVGDALIAPSEPGGIAIHQLVPREDMILTSGAYLAGDESVNVGTSMVNSPFSTFGNFSGTGVFLLRASGRGNLAISAYGSMHKYTLAAGEKRKVDNGHLVAWTASMKTSMKLASARAGILGSMTSGEGLHCEFVGPGVVYIQSHKPEMGSDGSSKGRHGGGRHSSGGNVIGACIGFAITIFLLLGAFFAIYFGSFGEILDGNYNNINSGNGDRYRQPHHQYGGGGHRQRNEF